MPTPYRRLDDKPYQSHYLLAECVLDFPVAQVWPHALRIGDWMSAHELRTLDGTPGTVGHFERVYPKDLGPEVGEPRYHLYGIAHLIPHKYIALEVLCEAGGSYGKPREWMSFDGILFTDMGASTQLTFLLIDAHMGQASAEAYAARAAELESARPMLEDYFENLRLLIEADAGRQP